MCVTTLANHPWKVLSEPTERNIKIKEHKKVQSKKNTFETQGIFKPILATRKLYKNRNKNLNKHENKY